MVAKGIHDTFVIEARECLDALTQGLLALDRGEATAPHVAELFRRAHTLKGAARVVHQSALAEMAHVMEDVLSEHRDSGEPMTAQAVSELLRLVDALEAELSRAAVPTEAEGSAPLVSSEAAQPAAVRVDFARIDALVEALLRIEAQLLGLRATAKDLDGARRSAKSLADDLGAGGSGARATMDQLRASLASVTHRTTASVGALEHALRLAREQIDEMRLTPASDVFPPLERAARDAARELGREAHFAATGGDARLDRNVLQAARDALLHLVRNAVIHGIEPPDERHRAGKAAAGRIALRVERRGDRVVFTCEDDGRGIDLAAVREAAVMRGIVSAADAEALTDDAALDLVFQPGVSTARTVSELSGRGVGLDVVRAASARFKGRVDVKSRPGLGTAISLDLPVSLASFVALALEAGGRSALVSCDAVSSTRRVKDGELVRSPQGVAILDEGKLVPFVPLALVLEGAVPQAPRTVWTVAVIRSARGDVALGVDGLHGVREVVMRRLPAAAGRWPAFAGAVVEASGDPSLVLDPEGLREVARAGVDSAALPAREVQKLPILVIDDSLTTRTMEQSMLEAAGYEVDVASSAEDGLEKAVTKRYGLFVVDVEMPGMNGFEFVAKTRRDPTLRETPAMLLTSLSSQADRERGVEAGASAYLIKGEFDQRLFLRRVKELLR
ncbi:Signal transduction histidine kinase CheA [Minicystis rosea]|nr:Signal transduction histidine kinase CheA [Minicystis rosea]